MTNTWRETVEAPKNSSDFVKLSDKEVRLRIISKPVIWRQDRKNVDGKNKPVNTRDRKPDIWEVITKFWPQRAQQFWLIAVYNILEKKVQCLTITQASIKNDIIWLRDDQDRWKEFDQYDIKIKQIKDGDKTTYSVLPWSKSELSEESKQIIENTPYNLELIFQNQYPISDYQEPDSEFGADEMPY